MWGKIIKKKFTILFICTLFIATVFPTVTCIKTDYIYKILSSPIQYSSQDDWYEIQKLTAIDGTVNDHFGYSVCIDGDIALIGAFGDDDYKGSAYVFTRFENIWTEQSKLIAVDRTQFDYFGLSVCIDGDTALIGAEGDDEHKGSAYVFTRVENNWIQQAKLTDLKGDINDHFGYSVSIDGDNAVIGAFGDDRWEGSVHVFTRIENNWVPWANLTASDGLAGDNFGYSVCINGDTILIGSVGDDMNKGSAYVFKCVENVWFQQAKLIALDGDIYDRFGYSVFLDGDTAIIGAESDNEHKGSAYLFTRVENTWTQLGKLTDLEGVAFDYFSESVSLDDNTVLIAAFGDDDYKGSAYVFNCFENNWILQAKITALDGKADDFFGCSVSIDNNKILIGAENDDEKKGSAYVFTKNNPPDKPSKPSGETKGKIGQKYTYKASTTDPDGNQLFYNWSWGDGTFSGGIGPYDSGIICEANHTWTEKGSYEIKVKAQDIHGLVSDWSDPLTIRMPKTYIFNPMAQLLMIILERFPFFEKILKLYL